MNYINDIIYVKFFSLKLIFFKPP